MSRTTAASPSPDDVHRSFEAMRAASRRAPAPDLPARRAHLDRLRRLLLAHRGEIERAVSHDFGVRARAETELLEIVPLLNAIRHARARVARWMRPERRHVDLAFLPARAWVRYEPLGVVAIMAPWNYPVLLTLAPLVDALAAGNRALLKPSELTPATSALLARLLGDAFSPDHVGVVQGGPEVAAAFSALPFDHLLFTGSTAVGRKVMQAAAANLTPVTLELGGKSPAIVCPDYPLEAAARSLAFGKFLNAGQTCIAPDYVLAPADRVEALAQAILVQVMRLYPKLADNDDYTAIISAHHYDRLAGAVAQAQAGGARVLRHEDAGATAARKFSPTLVLDAPADCLLMTEEIFGPVLPIVGYRTLEEAFEIINGYDRPLALYAFSRERSVQERVLDGATSGGVTLNGTLLHIAQDDLPFGGVGASGLGAYHGVDGFRRFSHARSVHLIGPVNVLERLGPPWGAAAAFTAAWLRSRRGAGATRGPPAGLTAEPVREELSIRNT